MACQEKYQCQFLSLIILSVRTDRLSDSTYLASHWKHYGGMLAFALLAWLPQVIICLDTEASTFSLVAWSLLNGSL